MDPNATRQMIAALLHGQGGMTRGGDTVSLVSQMARMAQQPMSNAGLPDPNMPQGAQLPNGGYNLPRGTATPGPAIPVN